MSKAYVRNHSRVNGFSFKSIFTIASNLNSAANIHLPYLMKYDKSHLFEVKYLNLFYTFVLPVALILLVREYKL